MGTERTRGVSKEVGGSVKGEDAGKERRKVSTSHLLQTASSTLPALLGGADGTASSTTITTGSPAVAGAIEEAFSSTCILSPSSSPTPSSSASFFASSFCAGAAAAGTTPGRFLKGTAGKVGKPRRYSSRSSPAVRAESDTDDATEADEEAEGAAAGGGGGG